MADPLLRRVLAVADDGVLRWAADVADDAQLRRMLRVSRAGTVRRLLTVATDRALGRAQRLLAEPRPARRRVAALSIVRAG